MIRLALNSFGLLCGALVVMLTLVNSPAAAQNFGSAGQSWSGNWGFSSAADRSLALQQAQVLRQAEGQTTDPSTVYNNYYDNRSDYVEANSQNGDVQTDFQIGDEIGENTYSVGSLNTGSTTIAVDGNSNQIDAVNSADTKGCVDGSISGLKSTSQATATYLPVVRSCD